MKTPEEIRSLGNQWALDNADETMATNSALNKGFRGGYNQCQEDNTDKKYTEEDLREAIKKAKKYFVEFPFGLKEGNGVRFVYTSDKIVESINNNK